MASGPPCGLSARGCCGAILGLAGGAVFGAVWGTLWNLIGATLGASAAFLLARTVAREWVAQCVGEPLRRLVESVTAEGCALSP